MSAYDTTSAAEDRAVPYDRATITFHWLTAFLVIEQWIGAQLIDYFPRGAPRVDARSVHITLGVCLGLILLARVWWRVARGRRLPPADRGALHVLARATHVLLYLLVGSMVLVGLLLTWSRGDNLFNMVQIPMLIPGDRAFARSVQEVHALLGYAILGVAGFHAAAALVHHVLWRDGVLRRMIPGL